MVLPTCRIMIPVHDQNGIYFLCFFVLWLFIEVKNYKELFYEESNEFFSSTNNGLLHPFAPVQDTVVLFPFLFSSHMLSSHKLK